VGWMKQHLQIIYERWLIIYYAHYSPLSVGAASGNPECLENSVTLAASEGEERYLRGRSPSCTWDGGAHSGRQWCHEQTGT